MKRVTFLILTLALLQGPLCAQGQEHLKLTIGPERIILPGGRDPFMFQSADGTLVLQANTPYPRGYKLPPRNVSGIPRTIRSTDHGMTWRRWTPPKTGGPVIEGAVTQLKKGPILIMNWIADGPRPDGYFIGKLWESRDDWLTVSGPVQAKIYLPEGKGGYDDGGRPYSGLTFHRTLLEMPSGALLATAYCWFKQDVTPSTYLPKMDKYRVILLRSSDRGRNWSLVSTIAVDPTVGEEGFNESALVRLAEGKNKGRFVVVMRTGSNNPLYQTESDDEGKTWTKPHALPFDGVDPDLIQMKSGILVCSFGWRSLKTRTASKHGIYLAFSFDGGSTWSHITQIFHGETTCYTSVREIKPGKLLLVYDRENSSGKDRAIVERFVDVRSH